MSAIKLSDDAYWVGVKDPDLRKFDIIMHLKYGTTYNSYLVISEKTALIDTVKKGFTEEFLGNIRQVTPLNKIDYLIINHTEPDHSGAIAVLLNENPGIQIICAASAVPFVKNVINREIAIKGVKDNEIIDLGEQKLIFKIMPYMHWPDTMMAFLPKDRILFSCDGFAAHLCGDSLYSDEAVQDYKHEFRYYWDAIMRPFSGYIRRNLPKLDSVDIGMIAPSHGPVIRKEPRLFIEKYKDWAADKTEKANLVTIIYASNYENTKSLAGRIAEFIRKNGFNISIIDAAECNHQDVRDSIEASKAILIGTPTFNGDAVKPIWDVVDLFATVGSLGKKAAVFGSYGWSGEGTKLVSERLSGLKLKVFDEIYRARLLPSDDELRQLDDYCARLIGFLKG